MKLRLIKKEDIPVAVRLYCEVWPEDKLAFVKKHFNNKVDKKEGFVIIENDDIAGILCFTRDFLKKADYIDQVVVDKKYRGKGVASRLMQEFEKQAKKRKQRRIFSSIEPKNKVSIKMHLKQGYKMSGYINHMFEENKKEILFSKKI